MARRKNQPATQPLARIVTQPEQAEHLLQAGLGSAFAIAQGSVEQLQALVPTLGSDQARTLHQRASALAVLAARHYREQRLTAAQPGEQPWRTGVRALVDGPTFESQFSPNWSDNCTPDAIEASTSPAAYLTAMYRWATEELESQADPDKAIPLAQRRPDLAGLVLDNQSLSQVVPTISLVNEILESAARKHLDDHGERSRSVDDALLEARYPFALPFERYMSQINRVLGRKKQGLGDLVRQLDPAFPYFSQGGLHSLRSDDALQMDLAIGPEQRALLLEAAYFPRGARRLSTRSVQTRVNPRSLLRESAQLAQSTFFLRHYGVQDSDNGKDELLDLTTFCQRTGLDRAGVESLLSIETCAPMASPNVAGLAPASPARFGSVYINAGQEPVLRVSSSGGKHTLTDATDDHFDRIQRLVRLSRWLELPFGELDQIIEAALVAEHGDAGRGEAIGENTLRALGLFRRLRRDYKVSAEDFAALLGGVAVYGRGAERPQFDQIFNDPTLFGEPLVLDDSTFNIEPGSDAEYRKILHLCGALGIGFETYLYVARYIVQFESDPQRASAGEGDTLRWSHRVISAFYRLTRLAAWVGLTSIEAIALLQLMGQRGHQYVSRLLTPLLSVFRHSDLSDTLSVVQSFTDAVQWCRDNDVTVSWLYQRLMPLAPLAMAGERERDLLGQMYVRVLPAIITEASFVEAGLPRVYGVDNPTHIDWFKQLERFISVEGLVYDLVEYGSSEDYEAALTEQIRKIIDALELPFGDDVLIKVSRLVMDARAAQQSLVWESLANSFGASAELSGELLIWAGGTCYQLLGEVLRIHDAVLPSALPGTGVEVMAEVLALLARLSERVAIVEVLNLSPLALRSYLRHPQWFGVRQGPRAQTSGGLEVDFRQLHALAQYGHLVEFARQPEQVMLDYLALVDNLPPDLSETDLQLIREDAAGKVAGFTGFGIHDTLETAREVTDNGIIATVMQLDHLVRVRKACQNLQLSTSAVLALSRLLDNSPRNEYREVAEGALSSLTARREDQVVVDQGELGQSETSWIVVDSERLVAKSGQRARCLLTVRNLFGQPVPGITVTWATDLGQLGAASSTITDGNGQVDVMLEAGDVMGTAQVVARFGLDRQVRAPLILIDCDDSTLRFSDPQVEPREALAGNLGEVVYRVQLLDKYNNPGRDRVVEWSTDLGVFDRPQTRADEQGMLIARLRSLSSGTANAVADVRLSPEQEKFASVLFLEQPYFQYVRFTGTVAATQEAEAFCRVVNLDGSPVSGVAVTWTATQGGFVEIPACSLTDAGGIARITYLSASAGEVRLTVNAVVEEQALQALTSDEVTVHQLPHLAYRVPEQQYFVIHQSKPAHFLVQLSPPAAGYPVTWFRADKLLATTHTDRKGVTEYQCHFTSDDLGDQTIRVHSIAEDDFFDFQVTVVTAHTELIVAPAEDSPGLIARDDGGFVVDRGTKSTLVIRALRSDGSGDDECRLIFSQGGGADFEELGVVFDQPWDEGVDCDDQGEIRLSIDCTAARFLAGSDLHSNELVIRIRSNQGVSREITVSLRDLIDLAGSEMRYLQEDLLGFRIIGLSGHLQRLNGDLPLQVRDGVGRLRVTLEGAQSTEDSLFVDPQGQTWFSFAVAGEPGVLKPVCTFAGIEGLEKRLYFVPASRTFTDDEVIEGATITVTPVAADGLVEDGTRFLLDQGGTYTFKVNLANADGPISHVGLIKPQVTSKGVTCRSAGWTDAQGNLTLSIDTSDPNAEAGNHTFTLATGPVSWTLNLQVGEFALANVTVRREEGGRLQAVLTCTRPAGQAFIERNWYGGFRVANATYTFAIKARGTLVEASSNWFTVPLPAQVTAVVTLPLSVLLTGDTDITVPALNDEHIIKGGRP